MEIAETPQEPAQSTGPAFISMRAVGELRLNVRWSKTATIAAAVALGASVLAPAYGAWIYMRLSSLGYQYGWGNVPLAEFPIPPASFEPTFNVLGTVETVGFLAGAVAFLFSISKIRWGLDALLGKEAFSYSWGWTIGSVFIPFVCLYRPWVGFAEVRRAVMGSVARQRISTEWKADGFNFDTLILAVVFFGASGIMRFLSIEMTSAAASPNFGLDTVDHIEHLLMADCGVRLAMLGIMVWYLWSLGTTARRLVTFAETADSFG